MEAMLDHNAAIAELLNDFVHQGGDGGPLPEEAALAQAAYDSLLSAGPEAAGAAPSSGARTYVFNAGRSPSGLPRVQDQQQAMPQLSQPPGNVRLPGLAPADGFMASFGPGPFLQHGLPGSRAGAGGGMPVALDYFGGGSGGWGPLLGPSLPLGGGGLGAAAGSLSNLRLPDLAPLGPMQGYLASPWAAADLLGGSLPAASGPFAAGSHAPSPLLPGSTRGPLGRGVFAPGGAPAQASALLSPLVGAPADLVENRNSAGSKGSRGKQGAAQGLDHRTGSQDNPGVQRRQSKRLNPESKSGQQGGAAAPALQQQGPAPAAVLQHDVPASKANSILGTSSLLAELRSRKRPAESEAAQPDAERSLRPRPLPASAFKAEPPTSGRGADGAKQSLLDQLLSDAVGNLSAEQERGLLAGMAGRGGAADAPPSPDRAVREESILAGLGVIAPEEIGLRPLRAPPPRAAPGGLLAALRGQREGEGLQRETPAASHEAGGLLARLRTLSSSEEAATRHGSASTVGRQPSTRDSGPLLRQLRVDVAREARAVGLGGRMADDRAAGLSESSPRVPEAASPLSQFGSGSLAVLAARGKSEESALQGGALPAAGRAASPAQNVFSSGSLAADLARPSSAQLAAGSSGLPALGLGRSTADPVGSLSKEEPGAAAGPRSSPAPAAALAAWGAQGGGVPAPMQAADARPPQPQPGAGAGGGPGALGSVPASQPGASQAPGRRVPPAIPSSRFSLEGAPGWRPPPSPPHTGASPVRAGSDEPDDSGNSRMWTVHSLSSWANGERGKQLQSRSSLHSRSSIQSQPSFHSWAGHGSAAVPPGATDSPLGSRGEAAFGAFGPRWGRALELPGRQRRSPSPGRAVRAARAGLLRSTASLADLPPPASPPKTQSSGGSPRNRLADFAVPPPRRASDQGSPPAGRAQPLSSPEPTPPRSPEAGGSGSPSPAAPSAQPLPSQQHETRAPSGESRESGGGPQQQAEG